MPKAITYLILVLIALPYNFYCQSREIDSIKTLLIKPSVDTFKVNQYNKIANLYRYENPDSSLFYAKKSLALSQQKKYTFGQKGAYFNLANYYLDAEQEKVSKNFVIKGLQVTSIKKPLPQQELLSNKIDDETYKNTLINAKLFRVLGLCNISLGLDSEAVKSFDTGISLILSINATKHLADFYRSYGAFYMDRGKTKEALSFYFKSLKISEPNHDDASSMYTYLNIGEVYYYQKNTDKALLYLEKTRAAAIKTKNKNIEATINHNMALLYKDQKNLQKALICAKNVYEASKTDANKKNLFNSVVLVASIYLDLNNTQEAFYYLEEAKALLEKGENELDKGDVYRYLSNFYTKTKQKNEAVLYGEKALLIGKTQNNFRLLKNSYQALIDAYKLSGNFEKALFAQKKYYNLKDSALSVQNHKEIMGQETRFNYEQKAMTDSVSRQLQIKMKEVETNQVLKKEQDKKIMLVIGLILVVGLSLFIVSRNQLTNKQKLIIEKQKTDIEKKSKKVEDSILYSKEIQEVFLKELPTHNDWFKDKGLVYKPKDVVSGDFYWYKEIGDDLFVVVGDCSGHGVPGAIISVLAIQSLEKIIYEIKSPDELHRLSKLLKQEFDVYYNQDNNVNIGLDYSVICFDKTDKKLFLSGSGCTILLKDKINKVMTEHFDSINIGGSLPLQYNPKTVHYSFNDISSVFLYTDGITDQRGGDNNKKFGTAKLKQLLENTTAENINEAVAQIELTFDKWKGNNQQIDDITFLGLQLNA